MYDPFRDLILKKILNSVNIITHTENVKNSLSKFFIRDKYIPVIPWGVDSKVLNYSKSEARNILGIGIDKKVFGFFGYILEQKGFDYVLNVWPSLNKDNFLLSVVHSDKPGEEAKITKFLKNNLNGENFKIKIAFASENDLAISFCAVDAILLPYKKFFQGESGIMSLACAYNIPLLASDTGKVGQVVKENKLGLVFKPDSESDLKDTIEKFSKLSEENISEMKENIKNYIKLYSWENIASQHLTAYKQSIK